MVEQMRLIEFVLVNVENLDNPCVGLFDAKDISRIFQYNKDHCYIVFKDGIQQLACGTLRTLTNRWIYTLEKKYDLYHDDIIRPSVMIYHRPDTMGINESYQDYYQLLQFVKALSPEILEKYQYIFDEYNEYIQKK